MSFVIVLGFGVSGWAVCWLLLSRRNRQGSGMLTAARMDFAPAGGLSPGQLPVEESFHTLEERLRGAERSRLFLEAVTRASLEAESFDKAIEKTIRLICGEYGWEIGHSYLVAPGSPPGIRRLVPGRFWHHDPALSSSIKGFRDATMAFPLEEGVGLPGQSCSAGRSIWVEDLHGHKKFVFLRTIVNPKLGLRSGLAVPVMSRSGADAILEFFSRDWKREDSELLAIVDQAGVILGRVSERIRATEELNSRASFLNSILSNVNDAIVTADEGGKVTSWNRTAEELFQFSAEEMLGRPLDAVIPERFRKGHAEGIARVANGGDRHLVGRQVELFGLRKDGTEFPIELSLACWTRQKNVFFTGVIRDISLRCQARETEAKMLAASKMSTLGEMAAGVAHEINNPLAVISILCSQARDLMAEERIDRAAFQELQGKVETAVERIARIVKGLRSFARNDENDPPESFSLPELIADTGFLCTERFRNNGTRLELPDHPPGISLTGHKTQLSQVLLNLFNNAFDAVQDLREKWVRLEVELSASELRMRVVDSGSGIPAGLLDRLFNPFFTTKPVGKGTGLGLSISKGIIEQHNGALEVDSAHPHTCFVLRLPLHPEPGLNGSPGGPAAPASGHRERGTA